MRKLRSLSRIRGPFYRPKLAPQVHWAHGRPLAACQRGARSLQGQFSSQKPKNSPLDQLKIIQKTSEFQKGPLLSFNLLECQNNFDILFFDFIQKNLIFLEARTILLLRQIRLYLFVYLICFLYSLHDSYLLNMNIEQVIFMLEF